MSARFLQLFRLSPLLLIGLLLLLSNRVFSAQLIDKIPTELKTNWSICIHYQATEMVCQEQKTPKLKQQIEADVTQFVYLKDFIISSDLHDSTLGLWLDVIDGVDEVRVNGHLIGKTGSFPPKFQSGFRLKRLYLIPSIFLKYNQFNQLEIKTFSSLNRPGLGHQPVVMGEYFKMAHHQQELDYVYVMAISIFLLLTVFQLFYYFMVKGSNETLYLSLYLISFAAIAYTRSQAPLHMGLDLSSAYKIEMLMISLAVVSFTLFIFRFFDLRIRKNNMTGIIIMAIPGLFSIIVPNPLLTRLIAEYGYWIVCITVFITSGSAVIRSILKRRQYRWTVLGLCLFGWFVLCYDALSQSTIIFDLDLPLNPSFLLAATTLLGISMSLAITHKYWQIFRGATYDHLTGTLLRPAFFQRLAEEIQKQQHDDSLLFVAMINIREIKSISASYGQEVGNKMLLTVSGILSKYLNPFDLVCHFSDDEFCIVARIKSKHDAENYLHKVHDDLSNTQQVVGAETELFIDAKLGGVIYNPDQHLSVSQLLQDANYGLAKAKSHDIKDYILLNNSITLA